MADVTTINLRGLDPEFVKDAKVRAIELGMTLKDYVVKAVTDECRGAVSLRKRGQTKTQDTAASAEAGAAEANGGTDEHS